MPRKGWVVGHKREFIERHQDAFRKAPKKAVVYRAVARGLLCRAGDDPFNFDLKKNDIVDSSEPSEAELDALMNTDGLDEAEVKKRQGVMKKLAADVGYYYRQQASKKSKKCLLDLNRIARAQLKNKKTSGLQRWHVYSRVYYHDRVKATAEQRYAEAVKKWEKRKRDAEAKGKTFTDKRPALVSERNRVTREFFKAEDAATKAAVERMFQEEVRSKKAASASILGFDEPRTPQQFQDALSSLALFAQPFVDATALKTGGVATMLVCAPMPDDGGELGVVSVHAGRTLGLVNEKWPRAFPEKFRVVQQNMIEFARDCFTRQERLRRALNSCDGPKLKDREDYDYDEEEEEEDEEEDDEEDDEDIQRRVQEEMDEDDDGDRIRARDKGKGTQGRRKRARNGPKNVKVDDRRHVHPERDHDNDRPEHEERHDRHYDQHERNYNRHDCDHDRPESDEQHYDHDHPERDEQHHDHSRPERDEQDLDHDRPECDEQRDHENRRDHEHHEHGEDEHLQEEEYEPNMGGHEQLQEEYEQSQEHDHDEGAIQHGVEEHGGRKDDKYLGVTEHDHDEGEHGEDDCCMSEEPQQENLDVHDHAHDVEMDNVEHRGTHPSTSTSLGDKIRGQGPVIPRIESRPITVANPKDPLFLTISSPICSPAPSPSRSHAPPMSNSSASSQRPPVARIQFGPGRQESSSNNVVQTPLLPSRSGLPQQRRSTRTNNNTRADSDHPPARGNTVLTNQGHTNNSSAASSTTPGVPPATRTRSHQTNRSVSAPNPTDKTYASAQQPGRRTTSLQMAGNAGTSKAPSAARAPGPLTDDEEVHEAWLLQPNPAWSDHVRKAVDACRRRGQTWGPSFADAVLSYVTFEQGHGFAVEGAPARKMNPSMTRPEVYRAWTKVGRPYERVMDLGMPVSPYREVWWSWWGALMPSVRHLDGGKLLDPRELVHKIRKVDDWEGFDEFCGKDGLLQVLLTLLWWGDAVHGGGCTKKDRADWDAACADFSGILDTVALTLGYKKVSGKRKSPVERPGPSKKPRKSSADTEVAGGSATRNTRKSSAGGNGLPGSQGKSSRRRR